MRFWVCDGNSEEERGRGGGWLLRSGFRAGGGTWMVVKLG